MQPKSSVHGPPITVDHGALHTRKVPATEVCHPSLPVIPAEMVGGSREPGGLASTMRPEEPLGAMGPRAGDGLTRRVAPEPVTLDVIKDQVLRTLEERGFHPGGGTEGGSTTGSNTGGVRFAKPPSSLVHPGLSPFMSHPSGMPAPPNAMGIGAVGVAGSAFYPGLFMSPHAAQLWAEISKPTLFEDKSSQWDQFDREWKRYEQLTSATGFPMPDPIKLEVLKTRVGPISQLLIQRMEEENPNQPFVNFYEALARTHAKDASEQARLAWNNISLKLGADRILTLDNFRKYTGEFLVQRNRVSNWTPTEEYNLIFKRLPEYWALRVKEEEHRRDRTKCWVKVTNAPDLAAGVLKEAFLSEEIHVKDVLATDGGFLVLAADEQAQSALVAMTGRVLEGKAVKIARTQVKMTGPEIFGWIEEKLKIQEEARELSRLGGGENSYADNPYKVQEVELSRSQWVESRWASSDPHMVASTSAVDRPAQAAGPPPSAPLPSPQPGRPPAPAVTAPLNQPSYKPWQASTQGGWQAPAHGGWHAPSQGAWQAPQQGAWGKGKGKGKGGVPAENMMVPHNSYAPVIPFQGEEGKGKGKGKGKGEGKGEGAFQRRSRSREQRVEVPSEPSPGVWLNEKGWDRGNCVDCQRAGRDYKHPWDECRFKRERPNTGGGAQA